jgi:Cu-Zn family superoxide dismutase
MKALLILLALVGCAHRSYEDPAAFAKIGSTESKTLGGMITFTNTSAGLRVDARIHGLTPNSYHGLHIHRIGVCDGPGYKTAGEHFNPTKHPHGSPGKQNHLGDLGNLIANADGDGKLNLLLTDAHAREFKKILGRSVLIHLAPDDQKTQPTGNSEDRIACGVITQVIE